MRRLATISGFSSAPNTESAHSKHSVNICGINEGRFGEPHADTGIKSQQGKGIEPGKGENPHLSHTTSTHSTSMSFKLSIN